MKKIVYLTAIFVAFMGTLSSCSRDDSGGTSTENTVQNASKPVITNADGWKVETTMVEAPYGNNNLNIEILVTYPQPTSGSNTPPNGNYYSAVYKIKTTSGEEFSAEEYLGYKPNENGGKSVTSFSLNIPQDRTPIFNTLTAAFKKN